MSDDVTEDREPTDEEIAAVAKDLSRLGVLIEGPKAGGGSLYVPADMQIDAAGEILNRISSLGGRYEESVRESVRPLIPVATETLVCFARGVKRDGSYAEIPREIREQSTEMVMATGFLSEAELYDLPFSELMKLLDKRMREMGFIEDHQA